MKRFFLFSIGYALVALLLIYLFRDDPGMQIWDGYRRTAKALIKLVYYLPYLIGALMVFWFFGRRMTTRKTMADAGWALAACLTFATAFVFIKTSLPYIVPFYADPFFADLDYWLHGGIDPWVLTHRLSDYLNPHAISLLYFMIWGLPATFFPVLLAFFDQDEARRNRYLILYAFVWIGLGNILAFAGSSVGPIYYDRLLGTERFVDLIAALETSGVSGSHLGNIQGVLWLLFEEHSQMIGSGISAFPSVHNGVATLAMLYLWERSRWLAPIGIAFCAAILFASVYVGWHYAIDGYVSILLVVGVWAMLNKRAQRQNTALAPPQPDLEPVPA